MAKTVFSCVGASMNKMGIYYDLFITLPQTAAYRNGDLSVWRIRKDLFIYCYKNIVIIELMNMDRAFVDSLTKPERVKTDYAEFIARERMSNAEQYAKEYGFKLESI